MTYKKTVFGILLIVFITFSLSAQLRDYIPIVRPVYSQQTREFFSSLSTTMSWIGYTEIADMLAAYAEGTYGSGFVYVAANGANYVVTNYHVVAEAESVNLEFEKQDGTIIVYQNCYVLAVDKTLDLALIAFQSEKRPFRSGLSYSDMRLKDGLEVWTAGYPGLLSSPMWQLGKGNITNAFAKVPELVDPKKTTLIQHSAQVDSGNSGGPLLVADDRYNAGYKVIGVNTWKIIGRQATNFSIPAAAVKTFIDTSLSATHHPVKEQSNAALEKSCRDFVTAFSTSGNAYKRIAQFISLAYVWKNGEAALSEVVYHAPKEIHDEIIRVFYSASPIEAARIAIAYGIYMHFVKQEETPNLSFMAVEGDVTDNSRKTTVSFTLAEKKLSSSWVYEQGDWYVNDFQVEGEIFSSKKDKQEDFIMNTPYNMFVFGGVQLDFEMIDTPMWSGGVHFKFYDYITTGVEFGIRPFTVDDGFGSEINTSTFQLVWANHLQLPLKVSVLSIIPYVSGSLMMRINMDFMEDGGAYLVGGGGVQLGFSEDPMFLLCCEYQIGYNIFGFEDGEEYASWLSLYLAVGF
ncbi:MAG: trypsin-like peptidase domain-containing protein [Spirochaetales bacterium]|nr:trypsin-like peptidase domain-containing protein [Spirochaetales bacterium]